MKAKILFSILLVTMTVASPLLYAETTRSNMNPVEIVPEDYEPIDIEFVRLSAYKYDISTESGVIHVKDWATGAELFNGSDAATVFQRAIQESGGGGILVHDGTYTFNKAITLTSNLILEGQSWNTIFYMDDNFNPVNGLGIICNSRGIQNVVIRVIRFDGNREGQTENRFCTDIGHVNNLTIERCIFQNGKYHGCRVDFSDNSIVRDCVFINNGQHGLVYRYSENIKIVDNLAKKNIGCGYSVGGASRNVVGLLIENNRAIRNVEDGIHAESGIVNAAIRNNQVLGNDRDGIRLTAAFDCLIEGNVITRTGARGIYMKNMGSGSYKSWPLENITVSNNQITTTDREGVFVEATTSIEVMSDITFFNNTISGSSRDGLLVDGTIREVEGLYLVGNYFSDNEFEDIHLTKVNDIHFSLNP